MDYRLVDDLVKFMDGKGMTNKYDHVILAGASAGAMHGKFAAWHETFWSHLAVAIDLHKTHKVMIIDRRNCGAYKIALGRYCCKSLFASLNTDFPGRRCGALKTMWGTTLLGAKLTGDLGNAPEGTSTSDYCLFPPLAGNLSFGILGLLQQYRPFCDMATVADNGRYRLGSRHTRMTNHARL